jgi:hypothetical protein
MIFLPPTAGNRLAWDRYTHIKKRTAEAKSEYCGMPPCLEVRKCAMLEKSHRMYKHAVGVYLVPVGLLMPSFGVANRRIEGRTTPRFSILPVTLQAFWWVDHILDRLWQARKESYTRKSYAKDLQADHTSPRSLPQKHPLPVSPTEELVLRSLETGG